MSISYEVGLGLGLPTFAATPTKSSYNDDISATAKAVLAQAGGPNKPDVFKKKQPQIRIVAQPAVQPAPTPVMCRFPGITQQQLDATVAGIKSELANPIVEGMVFRKHPQQSAADFQAALESMAAQRIASNITLASINDAGPIRFKRSTFNAFEQAVQLQKDRYGSTHVLVTMNKNGGPHILASQK